MSRPSPTTAVRQSGTTTLKGSLDRPANPLDRAHRRRRPTTTAAQSPTAPEPASPTQLGESAPDRGQDGRRECAHARSCARSDEHTAPPVLRDPRNQKEQGSVRQLGPYQRRATDVAVDVDGQKIRCRNWTVRRRGQFQDGADFRRELRHTTEDVDAIFLDVVQQIDRQR